MQFTEYSVDSVKAAWNIYKKTVGSPRAKFLESEEMTLYYGALRSRLSQAAEIPLVFLQTAFERLPGFKEELDRQELMRRDPSSTDTSLNDPYAQVMRRAAENGGDIVAAIKELTEYLKQNLEELKRMRAQGQP